MYSVLLGLGALELEKGSIVMVAALLHSSTVVVLVFALIALMTSAMILWIWSLNGRPPYLAAWAGAAASIGVTRALTGAVGFVSENVAIAVGPAVLFLAVTLLWAGARLFRPAPAPLWVVLGPSLLWLLACLSPAFVEAAALRRLITGGTAALFSALFAWELLKLPRTGVVRVLAILTASLGLAYALSHLLLLLGPASTSGFNLGVPNMVTGAPLFLAIGFLALALGYIGTVDREVRAASEARLREAQLRAETATREAAALRAGREEVLRLHGALPCMIFHAYRRPDGSIGKIYRGGDLEAVTGWPASHFDAMDSLDPMSDKQGTPQSERVAEMLRVGSGVWDWRLRHPDGGWTALRTHARRLDDSPDGREEFVGYVFNVTREREIESRALVAARLASLGEMAANIAHELKQPLQSISIAAELAQIRARELGAAELADQMERIVVRTHDAAQTLDHLRRFSRGEDARAEVREVPLDEAVNGALLLARDALHHARITVEVCLGEPVPRVLGHVVALERVLSNLILNAKDALAARPPGAVRRLRIRCSPGHEGTVHLTIADTGGGVPPDIMGRLFEPFVTTKSAETGTGLGLSICRGLVHAMNGSIAVRNDEEGAVFTITLPTILPSGGIPVEPVPRQLV